MDETTEATLSWEADWVRRTTGKTPTPDLARCIDTLSSIQRPYNWVLIEPGWSGAVTRPPYDNEWADDDLPPIRHPVEMGDKWMVVRLRSSMATYDFPELTRLVLAAHRNAVRVEISSEIYRFTDTDAYLGEHKLIKGALTWVESDEHPVYPSSCLRVQLNARQREGGGWERHPTIEDVLG